MNRPGEVPPQNTMPRRRFLDAFLSTSVGSLMLAVFYPVVRYISPPAIPEATSSRVLAAKISEMHQDRWKVFPFGSEAGILIESAPGQFRAFSATCTHLECTVQFDDASKRIWCACHNGFYDLDGKNVAGPPPRPLTAFTVNVEGEDIFVSRG